MNSDLTTQGGVLIATPLFYPHIGGLERSLFNLSRGLSRFLSNIIVFTTDYGGVGDPIPGVNVVRCSYTTFAAWASALPDAVVQLRPDALIITSLAPDMLDAELEASRTCRELGIPVVLRVPTSDHLDRHLRGRDVDEVLDYFDSIVCIDPLVERRIRETRNGEKVTLILNGVDPTLIPEVTPFEMRSMKAVYCGRVTRRKNVDWIPRIAAKLEAGRSIIFQGSLSYGESDYYEEVLAVCKETPCLEVRPTAWNDVSFVRDAGFYLLPSKAEGSPNGLLEAMLGGLVCVASDIEEHRAVVGDAGILLPLDLDAWCDAVPQVMSELGMMAGVARNARERALNLFPYERTLTAWLDVLRRLGVPLLR